MNFVERVINALINIHPWHSLVVHFPTAFAVVGILCILFALWRKSKLFEKFAFFCMAVTAAGTALAGLAGLRDNWFHFGGAVPYLNVKIFLATSLLLLASVATVARWRKHDLLWNPSTRILYLAAFLGAALLATVLGFVGGSIVFGF
jgi:uncharacterized membrane protein